MEYDAPGLIGTIVALAAVTFFSAVGLDLGIIVLFCATSLAPLGID